MNLEGRAIKQYFLATLTRGNKMFGTYKDARRILENLYAESVGQAEQRVLKIALLRLEIAEEVLREQYEADHRDMRAVEFTEDEQAY